MQDHSHKLLFLGLSGLMSIAALYGAQTWPTLFAGDAGPAISTAGLAGGQRAFEGAFAFAARSEGLNCFAGPTRKDIRCLRTATAELSDTDSEPQNTASATP
jgi:hypothetical protein